ncbi:hypothetical protein M0657_004522 [Pyricularia oryzae]|uniref:Heme peroxidase n=2 Tax=Pyricularia oryzae TaxID=318829 RepID=A0AA97NVW0_PYRO3|nr:hypothetical protein OOU_Y34scaffold00610g25 [Pyricularia oryzae Y34]KAI7924658.1 hypothetical protein M0657_004522 [Pyricularia oryzae]KAI7925192.1 hypothetical protein M9X92_003371 [Pyricularia oryzae]
MRSRSFQSGALVAVLLAATVAADPTWPNPQIDELEEIMFQTSGFKARLFTDNIRQCANEASGPGRKTAAEWLRTSFHDMSTHNKYFGTGGLDGSLQYELNSGENTGPGLRTTLSFLGGFVSSRSSLSDLIAMGAHASVRSCGGPDIPVRVGRVDATSAGAIGVPQVQNPVATFQNQFDRMGFNQAEMIQLVACGHTLGGVHSVDFPDLVTPGSGGPNGVVGMDSTQASFDNSVVTEYLDGTTQNPLVVGPSVQLRKNSDGRIFAADGNATVNAIRDPAVYQSMCRSILQRMIDTVPSGVTLSDEPITPYTVKPVDMQLTLGSQGSTLQLNGHIRIRTTTIPLNTVRNVVVTYKDRHGGNECGTCAVTSTVQGTGAGLEDTWAFFPVSASLSATSGISSFTVTINRVDGTSTVFDNNGAHYPISDAVLLQKPQSCLLQGSGALTVSAVVRNDHAALPINLGVTYQTAQTNSPVPALNHESIPMVKGDCVGAYTFYSATFSIPGGRSFAARLDIVSGAGETAVSDAFNLAADLAGTCQPFAGSQACADVTVTTAIPSSTNPPTSTSATTTPPVVTPTPTGVPEHIQNLGDYELVSCWTEGVGVRALAGATFVYDGMTLETCMGNCTGFAYFGTEYGRECYCGNSLHPSSGPADLADCNMQCSGNLLQYCGAGDRIELYKNAAIPTTTISLPPIPTATATPSHQPTVTAVDGGVWSFQECRTEATEGRALTGNAYFDDAMTLEACASACTAFTFFGVEYGRECYCGDSFGEGSVEAAETDCSFPCPGDGAQLCGAGVRLSTYRRVEA